MVGGPGGGFWWRAMRCHTGHGVVGVLGSQAQHVRGMCWESWGTAGRSLVVMWCFGMCHYASWRMTVVCGGLASFGTSSRVSGGSWPVSVGTGLCLEPLGVYGAVARTG